MCPGYRKEIHGAVREHFFRDTRDRKRLTGEACKQDIVRRDQRWILGIGPDVPRDRMVVTEILPVGDLGILVPFRCKDALATDGVETNSQAANSCEQVNKFERCRLFAASLAI